MSGKVQQAREALGLSFKYIEAFEKQAEALLSQQMTDKEFYALVEKMIPIDEENERARNLADAARGTLNALWKAPTQLNVAGTKWAAYNAFTEYADWARPVKSDLDSARAIRIVTGASNTFKNKALALL